MASFKQYTASGGASEAFSIPSFTSDEIKVYVDGVLKTATTHYNITSYTANGGTVTWTSGNVPSSGTVRIVRDTDVSSARATYAAGSSIKAGDLNDNQTQALRSLEEDDHLIQGYDFEDGVITTAKLADDAITGAKIADDAVNSEHYVDGSIDTAHIADSQITSAKIADGTIVNADISGSAAITGSKIVASTTSVAGTMSAADKTKLDGIEASATADQSNAEIRAAVEAATDSNVFTDADHSKLNAIEASATADQSNAEIRAAVEAASDSNVFTDADHSKLNAIEASATADQTASEIKSLIASSPLDASHLAADSVTTSEIADNAVNSAKILDTAITTAKIADNNITSSKILDNTITSGKIVNNAVTTDKIADAELTTLAGMQSGTASILADSTALTSTTAELNLLDGKSIVTAVSGSSTDVQLPTAKAVNDQIVNLLNEAGGFVPIANEVSFPNANPDPNDGAGTIVSIADAGGLKVADGSGSGTYAGTAGHSLGATTLGGTAVTITDIDTSLRGTTIAAGKGMLVQTTSTLNTYTYHRLVVDEAGVANAQSLVTSFNERYRVGSSNPTSSLDDGDLFFNTSSDKMLVYNATSSAWEEVQSVGNYFINTISSYSGTGGNNATFNGSAYRFVLSNPGANAEQHLVSVNGVIQKPNSGTSQPGEGFAIDGSSIIFSAAPATGSDFFIITIGASVNIGTPSDNTVDTDIIQNLAVTTAKIAADAVDGTKIADDAVGAEHIEVLDANLDFTDDAKARFGTSDDLEIFHGGGHSKIFNANGNIYISNESGNTNNIVLQATWGEESVIAKHNGDVELYYDNSKKLETGSGGIIVHGSYYTNDSNKIYLGSDNDLQIYHSGSHGYITEGTGNLKISAASGPVQILKGSSEDIAKFTPDGSCELYYDNSKKLETTSWGVLATGDIQTYDNNKVILGSGSDFQIYHDGTNTHLNNGTGGLYIRNENIYLRGNATDEPLATFNANGAVELYCDNELKLTTTTSGVKIKDTSATTTWVGLETSDGVCGWLVGQSNAGSGSEKAVAIYNAAGNETHLRGINNKGVELYYDNVKKLETASNGVHLSDSLFIPDNEGVNFGTGNDLTIYHNGNDSFITHHLAGSGNNLHIEAANSIQFGNVGTSEVLAQMVPNGACTLWYDNSKKFETDPDGVQITGTIQAHKNISDSDYTGHAYHTFQQDVNDVALAVFEHSGDSTPYGLYIDFSDASPDGNTRYFLECVDSTTTRMKIYSDGDLWNHDNNYTGSDRTLKENIVDATSKLEDLKKLKVRNFNWKSDYFPEKSKQKQLGFIAQEVEEVFPALVSEHDIDPGLPGDGHVPVMKKAIKQAWDPIIIKAMQELIAKVETLETKVAALEAK